MSDKEVYLFEDGHYPNTGTLTGFGPSPGWQLFPSGLTVSDFVDYYGARGATFNNTINIGYWNSTDDTGPNYELWNTIDWSRSHRSGDTITWGRDSMDGDKASFGGKKGYFRMYRPEGITAREKSEAFTFTCYDDSKHYVTLNFCQHQGRFGGNGSGMDESPATIPGGFSHSYLPHVVGFAFRWTPSGSHSEKECAFPRRALMHYVRDTGNKRNPGDQTGRQIISIEPSKQLSFSGNLGYNTTESPNVSSMTYRYQLSDNQFATYRSSFDRTTNQIKDKYRFIGFSIEFKCVANGAAYKTMVANLWDFMPIISSNNILSDESQYSPKEYIVVPDADEFRWNHALSTGSTYNNPGPCITKL